MITFSLLVSLAGLWGIFTRTPRNDFIQHLHEHSQPIALRYFFKGSWHFVCYYDQYEPFPTLEGEFPSSRVGEMEWVLSFVDENNKQLNAIRISHHDVRLIRLHSGNQCFSRSVIAFPYHKLSEDNGKKTVTVLFREPERGVRP